MDGTEDAAGHPAPTSHPAPAGRPGAQPYQPCCWNLCSETIQCLLIVSFFLLFFIIITYFHYTRPFETPADYFMYKTDTYSCELWTPRGAEFYVNSTVLFDLKFPPKSLNRTKIDGAIDHDYRRYLKNKCARELKFLEKEAISCRKLMKFGLDN